VYFPTELCPLLDWITACLCLSFILQGLTEPQLVQIGLNESERLNYKESGFAAADEAGNKIPITLEPSICACQTLALLVGGSLLLLYRKLKRAYRVLEICAEVKQRWRGDIIPQLLG
jgi:hypothetical protein